MAAFGKQISAAFLFWLLAMAVAPAATDEPVWYSQDKQGDPQVHFYFFWSTRCPHCQAALPFVQELPKRYPWLVLHSHEMSNYDNVRLYIRLAARFGQDGSSVPGFIFCERMSVGFGKAEDSGAFLDKHLQACYAEQKEKAQAKKTGGKPAAPFPEPVEGNVSAPSTGSGNANSGNGPQVITEPVRLPGLGETDMRRFSLPVYTLIIAGLDAFNPCAFFVLLFLLSLLVHARSRARMLFIGGIFVFFSGFIYFLFMAAWLNVFLISGELQWITALAGLIAVLIALLNIQDFFWFKRGPSLSIPEQAKPGLYQRMRGLLVADNLATLALGTVTLAIAANTYELLCTSGFPMLYTRLLTLEKLSSQSYYLYLALYNLIYVLPLLAIVLVFTWTLGARKLQEREGRLLKLMSGLMMLGLGLVLLLAPALLNNVLSALVILAVALLISGLAWGWERARNAG